MEHFTVEQVAAFLKMSPEQVIDLTTWRGCEEGEENTILFPSADLNASVWVQRIEMATGGDLKATEEELPPGCYDVSGGISGLLTWDKRGYATIEKVDSSPVLGHLKIHKDQLRISAASLDFFMEQTGIQGDVERLLQTGTPSPLPPADVTDTPDEHPVQETIEELCDRLGREGLTDKEIARALKQAFPTVNHFRIGRLVPANPGANISASGHRKRGARLLR